MARVPPPLSWLMRCGEDELEALALTPAVCSPANTGPVERKGGPCLSGLSPPELLEQRSLADAGGCHCDIPP